MSAVVTDDLISDFRRRGDDPGPAVIVTVDTEPDDVWFDHQSRGLANIRALPRLQALLDEFEAVATLLITYSVARDAAARDVLASLQATGGAEIGAHLHAWETPPFLPSGVDRQFASFAHELPANLVAQKLRNLTAVISEHFGPPASYRAGRFGIAAEHLRCLEQLGYAADSSVSPMIDWRTTLGLPRTHGGLGGVDFRFAPCDPYRPDSASMVRPGDAAIVELPVTVSFTRRTPRSIRRAYARFPALAKRLLRKSEILRPVWATPAEESESRLVALARVAILERRPLINIAFHSSELVAGGSPATRTAEQADAMFARLRAMLSVLATHSRCRFMTMSQYARAWSSASAGLEPAPC